MSPVRQGAMESKIRELQRRIRSAREELVVLVEQIDALADDAEEARVRWLVAETPLAEKESAEAHRHLELARRAASALRSEIDQCVADRDRFLHELPVSAPGR
jgi:predicted  nucleic acid-binding Zn-ribbon protein